MRYQIRHAVVKYAANTIIEDVNFEIHDHEKIAIVGRNGCGKTTLLKLISGEIDVSNLDSDEDFSITMAGNQKIGYLRQISFENPSLSVEEEILKSFEEVFRCEDRMRELEVALKEEQSKDNLRKYASLQAKMEAIGGYTYRTDMETMFLRFGFALEDLKRPIGTLSGGQQTKIAFIKLLLSSPDIMLLDEPTNHLDMPTIEWLEGYLKNYKKAVVLVSHDRMFLEHIIDVTYEIEYHHIKRYAGNYSAFMRQKQDAQIKQEKDYEAQQKEIERLTAWIEKWKNTPTKVASTRSKRKMIEHMQLIEKPRRFDTKAFNAQFLPRLESFKEVLNVKGLAIGYDHVLCKLSFVINKGERLAVIGSNGEGKSTLLKTLVGKIPTLGGSYTIGTNVQWGYFDQQAAIESNANPEETVLEHFWAEYPRLKEVEVRNALGSFLFSQEDVYKKMGQLSGGEKVRLELCKVFKKRPNFLILDEPTNHMDLVGKEALESILKNYTGTVLFVSHDRYFIQEIATGVLKLGQDDVKVENDITATGYLFVTEHSADNSKENKRTSNKTSTKASSKKAPTLDDVFDKKEYYNPGKIRSRLEKQKEKYEKMLSECEDELSRLALEQMNPELATDYEALEKIQEQIAAQEYQQESLLERMIETESELFEMEQDS